jgi:hypothetical protein
MISTETRIQLLALTDRKTLEALETLLDECSAELKAQLIKIPVEDPDIEKKLLIARARLDGAVRLTNLCINYLAKNVKSKD